jgi:phosphoribosylanthranilate isomerase
MSVRIKICGITRLDDALAAVAAGADALGFIFYSASPRHLDWEAAAAITRRLPPHVAAVGVLVNPTVGEVERAVLEAGVDTLQFHGDETPDFIEGLRLPAGGEGLSRVGGRSDRFAPGRPGGPGIRTIKAVRMQGPESLVPLTKYRTDLWLLDSFAAGARGGTGERFEWQWAVEAHRLGGSIVLAGGLQPENVAAAVRAARPYGVDVSSGVETAPGVKDPDRIRAFISAARSATD